MQTDQSKTKSVAAVSRSAVLGAIRVLLTPSCWLQNHPYCKAWDDELRRLIASHRFEVVDAYTAKLGDREIWIENYPYASMHPYGNMPNVRAKRATTLAAHDKLLADLIAPNDQAELQPRQTADGSRKE